MNTNNSPFLAEYVKIAEKFNRINPDLYEKFNVKRGLRNADGTGVLVGLTEIGEVHGYIIDEGEKVNVEGRLIYRGYDVRNIVEGMRVENRFGFEEVCYLLMFGILPTPHELSDFNEYLGSLRALPDNFTEDMILKAPSPDIMNKLARSVLAAYSYDPNPEERSIANNLRQCIELIARFPTMVAHAYQAKRHYYDKASLFIHSPQPELSTAENFLYMTRPDSRFTKLEAELLDLALVLHAEHGGGNNSAFSIHVVSSADTDTYSAIAAGVGSLKGAKHGGANNKVMAMMDDIKSHITDWTDEQEVGAYLRRMLRKEVFDKAGLVYGMGHAVYTLSDPRAILLKEKAKELAEAKGFSDEYNLYLLIERIAPALFKEEKGSDKPIAANVDFFAGFVYSMLNIPPELYTPIFAVSRISGWCAHRIEEIVSGGRIIRPAYKSVLPRREYVPLKERKVGDIIRPGK